MKSGGRTPVRVTLLMIIGAVIPVTAGVMRNIWYPKGMAEYVTSAKLQALGVKRESALERDSTFRSNTETKIERQLDVPETKEEEFVRPAPIIEAPVEEEYREPQIQIEMMSVRLPIC